MENIFPNLGFTWEMPSYGMWRCVDLVWTDVSEKERRFTQKLHGATSLNTAFFIVTAVKTSNLTVFLHMEALSTTRDSTKIYPEDGGDIFLRNVDSHKIYTAPHPW
jgi:hypothetical protein